MPLYLVRYIGTGTHENPYRPHGSREPGATWIRLEGSTPGNSFALLHVPTPINDSNFEHLGDDKDEELQESKKGRLKQLLRIDTLNATTLKDAVAELLMNPPPGRWGRLRPTKKRYEIWLNNELWFTQDL